MATTEAVKKMGKKASVFDELVKASGIVPDGGEEFAAYAERLCEKVSGMEDADFGKLSQPARTWFDKAVDAINETKPHEIPVLVGSPFAANGAEVKPEAAPAKKVVEKKAAAAKLVKPEVKGEEAKPTKRETPRLRTDSINFLAVKTVLEDPGISFENMCSKIGQEPKRGNHAWNCWDHTRHILKVATEIGKTLS